MSNELPRGLRNNNPGNIRVVKGQVWQGEITGARKTDNSFCEFVTIAHGYRALIKLLQNYRRKNGLNTLRQMIQRWAPPHENNTTAYLRFVAGKMGVPADCVPDVNDKHTMCVLAAAISEMENGIPAQMPDVLAGWELLNE